MNNLFLDPYFLKIAFGTLILGFVTGSIGLFSTLRKQALVGDALSHAAFPGVILAFIIFGTKDLEILLLGAIVISFLAMGLINLINKYTTIKFDASLALILSSFFSIGNVLMLIMDGGHGLNRFIFGEAATMLQREINLIVIVALVSLLIVILFWRHLKLYIFDQEFYQTLGFNKGLIKFLLTILTVLVVVISIRTIGVVLMSALLIAPAITSRLLSNKLSIVFILSGLFGALSAFMGTTISFLISGMPTGPSIVLILSAVLLLLLLLAPKNGIISKAVNQRRHKKLIHKYHPLVHIYEFNNIRNIDTTILDEFVSLNYLKFEDNEYLLTNRGIAIVNNVLRGENLWT